MTPETVRYRGNKYARELQITIVSGGTSPFCLIRKDEGTLADAISHISMSKCGMHATAYPAGPVMMIDRAISQISAF